MQLEDIAIRETRTGQAASSVPGDAKPGILVPVNASASAYNALAYALQLARALQSPIHLFHVTDANELGESSNPLVISRMLDRMEKKATNCVLSLKEMIEESGIRVSRADSMIGNVERLIDNKVEEIMPEFIVLGKGSLPDRVIKHIARSKTIPVLVVPESTPARLPSSMLLSAVSSSFTPKGLEVACRFIQGTAPSVATVSVRAARAGRDPWHKITRIAGRSLNVHIDRIQIPQPKNPGEMADFIHVHEFDLVCFPRNRRPLWRRLFQSDRMQELPFRLEIPTMLL